MNRGGLLHTGRVDLTARAAVPAPRPPGRVTNWPRTAGDAIGLADVIGKIEATILIGLSTVGVAAHRADRPRDGPQGGAAGHLPALQPHEPFRSQRRGLDPLDRRAGAGRHRLALRTRCSSRDGRSRLPSAANVFIFPAVGLGVVASGARRVTDGMMLAAARAQGRTRDSSGALSASRLRDIRSVARAIATAVGLEARAGIAPKTSPDELRDRVAATQWTPEYGRIGGG